MYLDFSDNQVIGQRIVQCVWCEQTHGNKLNQVCSEKNKGVRVHVCVFKFDYRAKIVHEQILFLIGGAIVPLFLQKGRRTYDSDLVIWLVESWRTSCTMVAISSFIQKKKKIEVTY